jgi:hypothetical protein
MKITGKNKRKKTLKNSYYYIVAKSTKYLYGVFPLSEDGLIKAKSYLKKIDSTGKNFKILIK